MLAAFCTLLVVATVFATRAFPAAAGALDVVEGMAVAGITINFLLAVFNLLPVPPLDGWHVLKDLLPARLTARLRGVEAAGFLIFIALFVTGVLGTLLWPAFQLERLSWALIRWWT
jgi:Zn-dependent protease